MALGKNKIINHCRLYVGGYDLSGDSRTFDRCEYGIGQIDTTGWSDEIATALSDGMWKFGVYGYQAFMDDAAGKSSAILGAAPTSTQLVLAFGGGAAPVAGDLSYLMGTTILSSQAGFSDKIGVYQTDFASGTDMSGTYIKQPFGRLLYPKTDLTDTANGSSVDHGAATAAGGFAVLQVFTATGVYALKVQHSANNADWSDLITFTKTGAAVGSELKQTSSGTVYQYLRFQATKTSGTITAACAFARFI
jgi:hypothetical protein